MISSMTAVSPISQALQMALATSCGWMRRLGGNVTPAQESVRVAPGRTAVTLMPWSCNSNRRDLVKPSRANFVMV